MKRCLMRVQAGADADRKAKALSRDLLRQWDHLWTFAAVEGVEPTNNRAERALRPLVIIKRIFQRLPSVEGKRFVERLLSLGATARMRGVAYFDWLLKALRADKLNQPLPALEPA